MRFPLSPTKWTVEVTDTTARSQAAPTASVWYNLGGMGITIPIGLWNTSYKVMMNGYHDNLIWYTQRSTLSTANNSESDNDFTCIMEFATPVAQYLVLGFTVFTEKVLLLASKDIYYLNSMTDTATINNIDFANNKAKMIIRAVCAYL